MTVLDARWPRSQRFRSPFAGSNAHRLLHLGYKDFAVADLSGLGFFQNRLDRALCAIVTDHDLKLYFWKKIHGVLGAAINLAVPLLPPKSFHLAQSHSFHARCDQCLSYRFSFKWLDNSLDFFHRAN